MYGSGSMRKTKRWPDSNKRGCAPQKVAFTAKGRKVSFTARPAGVGRSAAGRQIAAAKFGHSGCARSPAREAAIRQFKAAAHACKGKADVSACVAKKLG